MRAVAQIAVVLMALGCAGWPATHRAGFERMAAARLTLCVQNNRCQFLRQCFAESAAHCVDAGYEPSCGEREPESTCGENVK